MTVKPHADREAAEAHDAVLRLRERFPGDPDIELVTHLADMLILRRRGERVRKERAYARRKEARGHVHEEAA
jgi:hypothetical protein